MRATFLKFTPHGLDGAMVCTTQTVEYELTDPITTEVSFELNGVEFTPSDPTPFLYEVDDLRQRCEDLLDFGREVI